MIVDEKHSETTRERQWSVKLERQYPLHHRKNVNTSTLLLPVFCRQTFLMKTWCILISAQHWRMIVSRENKNNTGLHHASRWEVVIFYWFKWISIWATFHSITTFVLISCILPVCIWCCHCQYILYEEKDHGFLPFAAGFYSSALPETYKYINHESWLL